MIKHVIFDFDGTIVDSRHLAFTIFNELAEEFGCQPIKQEELAHLSTLSIYDRIKVIGFPTYKLPKLLYEGKKRYKQASSSLQVFDGIEETLASLENQGIDMGIISSNTLDNISSFLSRNDIDVFDKIHCASNIFGKHKVIKAYLKKYQINVNDVLYVGDELRDIISCKKINVKIAAVTWGYDSIKLLQTQNPEFLIDHPKHLLNCL